MAIYTNLKVFKESYDLLLLSFQFTSNLKRDVRFTLGENLKKDVYELCSQIYCANIADNKCPDIHHARELIVRIKLHCRILADLKQISPKLLAAITVHTESINSQLDAWYKYQSQKINPPTAP